MIWRDSSSLREKRPIECTMKKIRGVFRVYRNGFVGIGSLEAQSLCSRV
jgi:hypothetical protein